MKKKQLAIIKQVSEVETKSGVAFDKNINDIINLSEQAKAVTSVDHPSFKEVKKELQVTRKYVNDYFMGARAEFNRMAKGVIEVEKLVLAEFVPEEDRLIAMDKAEKARLIVVARTEALPLKHERITTAGIEFTDEEILAMEDADFELEFAMRLQAKVEADRVAEQARIAEANAKLEAEKAELQREVDKQNAIERARKEERDRAEEALRVQKETAEREKREAEERRLAEEQERIERAEREKREAEEQKAREEAAEQARIASAKYQAFLTKNKYNESNDIIIDSKLYRFVAEYKA
jgi:hypothetical protein